MTYINIEETIRNIELRPKMYIERLCIDTLYSFLAGYLLCSLRTELAEEIDEAFKKDFSSWSKNWLLINSLKDCTDDYRTWNHLFRKVAETEEEDVELFFQASKDFFAVSFVKLS